MADLISTAQKEMLKEASEEPILRMLRIVYPDSAVGLQSSKASHIDVEGRDPILLSELDEGLWEDVDCLDDIIANANHTALPTDKVVRIIAAPYDSISGPSILTVASKDFRLVFDDVDAWFIQTCADMLSRIWNRRLLSEVMKAKEKFLRGISHQLRTPIHGILGCVELLSEELRSRSSSGSISISDLTGASQEISSSESVIYLDTIKTAGRDLISIVNSMITLNRWADIAMTDRSYAIHDIYELEKDLVNEVLKTTAGDSRYRASVFFNHDVPPDCQRLRIDLNILRESVFPLIMNAIQNTSDGVVLIATKINPDYNELIIDVEDTGRGIPLDHHQRIFESYEQVGIHSTGVGLGLTLASKFAALLNGTVVLIRSEVDKGSHFRATFREVECVRSPLLLESPASKPESLPSQFYNMPSSSDGVSLSDYFAKLLISTGFSSSDTIDDSLIIFDFVPDLEQRRAKLSQIPSRQVAICLIPVWEDEPVVDPSFRNIIYVRGPISSSSISSVLEEADKILASRAHLPTPYASHIEAANMSNGPSIEHETQTMIEPPQVDRLAAQQPADKPVEGSLGSVQQPRQADVEIYQESGAFIPCLPAPLGYTKPMALLVDDNDVNLRIMQMYCRKRGLPFCCAGNGLEAIEIFSKHQTSTTIDNIPAIQLILMDLQMPVCDGIEATKQIRSLEKKNQWGESILFIVTGQDSLADRTEAEDAGADEYFVKPLGMKVLDRSIKQYFPTFEAN
jgi:signal transduction histidine kinase/CheY-like chemotaxis protein